MPARSTGATRASRVTGAWMPSRACGGIAGRSTSPGGGPDESTTPYLGASLRCLYTEGDRTTRCDVCMAQRRKMQINFNFDLDGSKRVQDQPFEALKSR